MKNRLLGLFMLLMCLPFAAAAQQFVNLTPTPLSMTQGTGELVLPQQFKIATSGLSDEMAAEVTKFVDAFNAATGYTATVDNAATDALFSVAYAADRAEEGYKLTVTSSSVAIEASAPIGLYFAFQSVKKMLPANVMAGKQDAAVASYALPVVTIIDQPRFSYRGFMLDVSRHFFTIDEVKRMIDVMSYYKMNRFHWHLSDDQGWRVEIKKYPKLTSVGSIAPNSRFTDLEQGQYWINKPYGPYFYTQEQLRDVVAYAKERHIEIIPEIDMPGHFTAALVAYPEYSCSPNASRSVWIDGGISADVLNVADSAAVQFCKDILTELMDIFPYEYIHIGGDECPTSAWEGNAACQTMYQQLGLTSYRALQSHFIKDMGDFIKANGRKLVVWNEAISASGADTQLIQQAEATVFCWMPAASSAAQAAGLKLNNVYTPWGPYYINRKQSTDPNEPPGAGDGTDNVQKTYNEEACGDNITAENAKYYTGVQGTFWTEHVSDREYMEYLALPRLIAIAEAGWTPKNKKDFTSFCKRITADSVLLNYGGYLYNKDYMGEGSDPQGMVMPKSSTAAAPYYYRLVTNATGERAGKCIELLREGSPIITEANIAKGAAKDIIWTTAQVDEGDDAYDYQFWAFEEDPNNPGYYALVCRAEPTGSLNSTPTVAATNGRWTYDPNAKHYDFLLAQHASGYGQNGDNYYYSINSKNLTTQYLNASLGGQGYAVNVYGNPADGNGGLWTCVPDFEIVDNAEVAAKIAEVKAVLSKAKTYTGSDKQLGRYGATEAAALQGVVADVNLDAMTADQLAAYAAQLDAAYVTFKQSLGVPEVGKTYQFVCSVDGFENISIVDDGTSANLRHSTDVWANTAWEVTSTKMGADGLDTLALKNVETGRYIGAPASSATGKVGYPVAMATDKTVQTLIWNINEEDFTFASAGKNMFPVPANSGTQPSVISSGSTVGGANAVRLQGAAWTIIPVKVVTFNCEDENGNSLGSFKRSVAEDVTELTPLCPEIKNHTVKTATAEDNVVTVVYQRSAYAVTTICRTENGALVETLEEASPVGETYTVALPEVPYFTFVSADVADGATMALDKDTIINAVYSTTGHFGVKKLGEAVDAVEAGKSYVIYDAHADRYGYRRVVPTDNKVYSVKSVENGADPYTVWTLEASGSGFKVKNELVGLYVPSMTTQAEPPTLSTTGAVWTFTKNSDGTFKIKGTNGICWDGLANGALVGWNDPGHPYKVFEYFVEPYFDVIIQYVDENDVAVAAQTKAMVKAGEAYVLNAPTIDNYTLQQIEGADALTAVADNVTVKVVYKKNVVDGIGDVLSEGKAGQTIIVDLSGRRVKGVSKGGIYIINGQKVLVK